MTHSIKLVVSLTCSDDIWWPNWYVYLF